MSFENGSIGLRMFYLERKLPKDVLEKFSKHAAPPLKTLGHEKINGWVGGRHLLYLPITDDNAYLGGYLRLILMQAERKVPALLLRAECMLEEVAHMRAENQSFVDRKTRSEIRKEVHNRLLPTMPPTLRGIPFVYDERETMIYVGTVAETQTDAFVYHFQATTGLNPIPVNPGTVAAKRRQLDVRDWPSTSFSPEVPDAEMESTPGLDFLTWLWFASEKQEGIFKSKEHGDVGVALEGPLLFTRTGDGAHEIALRKGLPTVSAEAKTALLSGKKLRRAKLMLGHIEEAWNVTLDADTFVFRSVKLPEPKEMLDPASRFQDRVQKLGLFRDLFFELFDKFLNVRADAAKWADTKKQIHKWAADRSTRR